MMKPLGSELFFLYWTWCWDDTKQGHRSKTKSEAIVQGQNMNTIETRIVSVWSTDRFQFLETGCMVGTAGRHLVGGVTGVGKEK